MFRSMRADPSRLGLTDTRIAEAIVRGVALTEDLRGQRTEQLARLVAGVGRIPIALIPELFDVAAGLPMTRAIASQLRDELGL